MSSPPIIGKAADPTASVTAGSFEQELRHFLQVRAVRSTGIAFAISVAMFLVFSLLIDKSHAPVKCFIMPIKPYLEFGHAVSFGLAFLIALSWRGRATARFFQNLVFLVFGFNLFLAIFAPAGCRPDHRPFFEMAILAFVPAAFVPWRLRYQIGLGLIGLVCFVGSQLLTYLYVPGYKEYWDQTPMLHFRNEFIWGTAGIATLGAVATYVSFSLYTLRKTIHRASRLGNYELMGELGKGGMGKVFLARHALMCRPTAVKVMKASGKDSRHSIARFEREVNLSSQLTHPNTIHIYDFGRTRDNVFYYVMEYLQGLDLHGFVERFGPMPVERIIFVMRQACSSLFEAHVRGIVHRDIKPSNIFLTHRGGLFDFVKVLDFGLAKEHHADPAELTQEGFHVGTPKYIAPESLTHATPVDARSDIYTLGAVIYCLLTGRAPFESTSSMEALVDHVKTIPTRPSELSELEIPQELDDIVMKCLEKDPDKRFQCTDELRQALEAVPVKDPWSHQRAKAWWELHGLLDNAMPDCIADMEPVSSLNTTESLINVSFSE